MNWQLLQEILNVLGFLILVVSIYLLIKQNIIAARSTRASVYQNISTLMIEIDRIFIDHPELRPYFYNNADISEEHPDYNRVISIAETLVDFIDGVLTLAPNMPEYPWDTWEHYFRDIYASSPTLQKYWGQCGKWYPDPIKRVLDSVG